MGVVDLIKNIQKWGLLTAQVCCVCVDIVRIECVPQGQSCVLLELAPLTLEYVPQGQTSHKGNPVCCLNWLP